MSMRTSFYSPVKISGCLVDWIAPKILLFPKGKLVTRDECERKTRLILNILPGYNVFISVRIQNNDGHLVISQTFSLLPINK